MIGNLKVVLDVAPSFLSLQSTNNNCILRFQIEKGIIWVQRFNGYKTSMDKIFSSDERSEAGLPILGQRYFVPNPWKEYMI